MVVIGWGADPTEYIMLIINSASILRETTNDEYE
jgi:hypothetical protein